MAKTPVPSGSAPDDATPGDPAGTEPKGTEPARTEKAGPETAGTEPTSKPAPRRRPAQPVIVPTEQLPLVPPPVSAGAAASGGATGLGGATGSDPGTASSDRQPSVFRRHPLATGVAAGIIAVVLVSGLTAWGVGTAVTASLTSSNSAAMAMPTSTATPAPAAGGSASGGTSAGAMAAGTRVAFRATIQSISGDSWTILTRDGRTVTVNITSTTRFGTKASAETSTSFAVGDSVIIVATRDSDGTPVATRVATSSAPGTAPAPTATPPT